MSVTVSGNIQDLSGSGIAGQAIFTLVNYATNIPRVIGTTTIATKTYTFTANASGVVSGNILGNDVIDPAGTYYNVAILDTSKTIIATYAFNITGSSFNMNSATPITTAPVVTPPTGDNTYQRLDGGNTATGSYVPTTNNTVDLGAVAAKWRNGYFVNLPGSPVITTPTISSPSITGTVGGLASYTSPSITGTVGGGASYTAPSLTGTIGGSGTYTTPTLATPTITGTATFPNSSTYNGDTFSLGSAGATANIQGLSGKAVAITGGNIGSAASVKGGNNAFGGGGNVTIAAGTGSVGDGASSLTGSGVTINANDSITGAATINLQSGGTNKVNIDPNGLEYPRGNITLANGANVDIAITGNFHKIVGPSGVFSVSGFTNPVDGKILYLFNSVAFAMTIKNEDAGESTAARRITTLTGADVTLRAGTSFASFIYDGGSSRWILTGTN